MGNLLFLFFYDLDKKNIEPSVKIIRKSSIFDRNRPEHYVA